MSNFRLEENWQLVGRQLEDEELVCIVVALGAAGSGCCHWNCQMEPLSLQLYSRGWIAGICSAGSCGMYEIAASHGAES